MSNSEERKKQTHARTHTYEDRNLQFMQISFDKSALNLLKVDCGIESARTAWAPSQNQSKQATTTTTAKTAKKKQHKNQNLK